MLARRRKWVGVISLGVLLLTGCWDRREIEERSNVMAIGVDSCDTGPDCGVVISRQIAIPGRIPQGSAEGVGGGSGGDTVEVTTVRGRTPPETLEKAQAELNRTISFGQTRVHVIGEEYAASGLETYVDYIRRLPEIRRLMWVTVSEGRAEDVVRARPELERVPALFLNDMIETAVKTGRLPQISLGEFLVRLSNPREDPVVPLVRMADQGHPMLSGVAVFRGHTMVGKLDLAETATLLHLRGERRGGEELTLSLSGGNQATVTIYGHQSQPSIGTQGGRVHARYRLTLEGELTSLSPGLSSADPRVKVMIEAAGQRAIARRSTALVERLQRELRSDALGLGELVRARMPSVSAGIPNWQAAFEKATFEVQVRFYVRRYGMALQ